MQSLPLLMEVEELNALLTSGQDLSKVLIIDQSKLDNYLAGHIPSAVHLNFADLQFGQAAPQSNQAPGSLPKKEQLSVVFSNLGLTEDTHVIAYDDEGGGWAGRWIWVLDMIGHKQYSYVNGGIHAWMQAGLPTEQGNTEPTASNYKAGKLQHEFQVDAKYIQSRIGASDFAIWDARSPAEYEGTKVFAARGGHIPGAVNFEWTAGMDNERALRILDLDKFSEILNNLGLTKDKEIITHCQTHHRSGFTYLVGKILGLNIKGYAGSWSEWGNREDTPVKTGDQP